MLQLQVEPATLERVCRRTASDDGTLMVTKNEFQSLAKESATYGETSSNGFAGVLTAGLDPGGGEPPLTQKINLKTELNSCV